MSARIKISQVGLPAGVAGVSRTDGLPSGGQVTLEDVAGTGASTFHLLWGPPADTTSESSLAATGNPNIWTFTPTAGLHDTFLIELRDSGVPVERRIFGIRTPSQHLLIPAFNERASRHASWDNDGAEEIERSENNAVDFPTTELNAYPYAGWWRSLRELYQVVEAGTGGIADHSIALVKLVQGPALSLLGNPSNLPGDAQYIASSAGFQYIRTNAANTALEWADLGDFASASIVFGANEFERAALTGAISAAQNANATLFSGIRDNGSAENDRSNLNFVNTTSINLAVTDDAGNDELEITAQRAALTGAIVAAQNANATLFAGIRDNGAAENDRTNLNFLSSTSITLAITDDSGNDELEIVAQRAALTGEVTAPLNSNATTITRSTDFDWTGWHTHAERGTSPAVGAGKGAFWTLNTAPTAPMFTDDVEADWSLAPNIVASMSALQSATNSTTAVVGTSFSVPANTFRAGTLYELEGYIVVRRGATTNPANLTVNITLGGTVYATTATSIFVTANAALQCLVKGYLLCLSSGAAATFVGNVMIPNNITELTPFNANTTLALLASSSNDAASGTTKDTTAALALSVDAAMSAAVANLKITWTSCTIRRAQP